MPTLYDKVYSSHLVQESLIYIDRHLLHEVTSPQAFQGLEDANRVVRRRSLTLATLDHNIPTSKRPAKTVVNTFITQKDSREQCLTLEENVKKYGLTYFNLDDARQGIVHVIGPEQGFTLPGTTLVCGDSHTSTHGAFGALAFGIGTSEVEHVLATQTLPQQKSKNMRVYVDGVLEEGITSKDLILHIIGVIGTAGGTGHVIEFAGPVIQKLSMESRMSMCNMSIEAGARAGMIAPDETTFAYLKGRPLSPKGELWERAVAYWKTLKSDDDAKFDTEVKINASDIIPTVTWGTTPQDVVQITGVVPSPNDYDDPQRKAGVIRSLEYMGLTPGVKMTDIKIDKVFIGSCTNSRIEDLRQAAAVAKGNKVAPHVYAMVVPGSGLVKRQAEDEGLSTIFIEAGFDWREAGCSMCLGMNEDQLKPGERCASTSNRNFEGRQGLKGRTHLMSPGMAAAAAISGNLADVREIAKGNLKRGVVKVEKVLKSVDYTSPFKESDFKTPTIELGEVKVAGGMPKFTTLKGVACPMPISNVDTDKIIPKQFLKTIKRTGLGAGLFYELRYLSEGVEDPKFVLNESKYRNSKILIAGENFGCGSSREHAPWALNDFGIRCIIAPSFADIFENNTTKNGMLPITLPQSEVDLLMKDCDGSEFEVDLVNQTITRPNGSKISFKIDEFRKHCLLNGLDDIGLTLQHEKVIREFEAKRAMEFPWLNGFKPGEIAVEGKKKVDW